MFEDIENGKNKSTYKPLEQGDLLDAFNDAFEAASQKSPSDRKLTLITGKAGSQALADAMREQERLQRKLMEEQKRFEENIILVDLLYVKTGLGKITQEKANKLCGMIQSSDDESRDMAKKIIQAL
jgi:hypothetical protein